MTPAKVAYRDYVLNLREVCRAHLCAAGWLLYASATLVHAAETRHDEDDAMLARLGEIRPAGDDHAAVESETDTEFLLDRASSHRRKAAAMTDNALKLFGVLADILGSHVSDEAELGFPDQLSEHLGVYLSAVDRAAAEIANSTAALDEALGDASEWQDPLVELRGAGLFLSEESALISGLLESESA